MARRSRLVDQLRERPRWPLRPYDGPFVGHTVWGGENFYDIALTGGIGWGSIPIAFSNGNGSFNVTNNGVLDLVAAGPNGTFLWRYPSYADDAGVKLVGGDCPTSPGLDRAQHLLGSAPVRPRVPVDSRHLPVTDEVRRAHEVSGFGELTRRAILPVFPCLVA